MNYLGWNDALATFFFNPEKAGIHVYLYIDKKSIVAIGRESMPGLSDYEIWRDFLAAVREGFPGSGSSSNLLDKAIYCFRRWNINRNSEFEFPSYIAYLVLFIYPLSLYPGEFFANSYHPQASKFIRENDLPPLPYNSPDKNWNQIWKDLEYWSIIEQNTDLGIFEIDEFKNQNWVYVGKPLSQCLLPTFALNRIPHVFESEGLVPEMDLGESVFRDFLLRKGHGFLRINPNVVKLLRDKENEMGNAIVRVVKRVYDNWEGVTDISEDESAVKKGWTVCRLFMCLQLDLVQNLEARVSFRLKTRLEYPEDLKFDESFECMPQSGGWSKPLKFKYFVHFEKTDQYNKWKARFPAKDIRLFVPGHLHQLNNWVETDCLNSFSDLVVIVRSELAESVQSWATDSDVLGFGKFELTGIPDGFVLFKFRQPKFGHPDIPLLQFREERKIKLAGGLKAGHSTYYREFMPSVEVVNGTGSERIILKYKNSDERFPLKKSSDEPPAWSLPEKIESHRDFVLEFEDLTNGRSNRGYRIVDFLLPQTEIGQEILPRRDKFGYIYTEPGSDEQGFAFGSQVAGINYKRQLPYSPFFRPITLSNDSYSQSEPEEAGRNTLLYFLSARVVASVKDFYEAFEYIYQDRFPPEKIEEHPRLSLLKRNSLNMLDFLGYLDYEYSTGKIVVNPPQLILRPAISGRSALLIGARSPGIIAGISKECQQLGLILETRKQHDSNDMLLLPDTVIIHARNGTSCYDLENRLVRLAEICNIEFHLDQFPQFALFELSGCLAEYESTLTEIEYFEDFDWSRKVFNPNLPWFERSLKDNIDPECSLVEYRLNEYRYKHILWRKGRAYRIDKNWGRFLILQKFGKRVIFNDKEKNLIAIPASTPLPRLMAEGLILMSGSAPVHAQLKLGEFDAWFNIYDNVIHNLAYNGFKKLGQEIVETKITIED